MGIHGDVFFCTSLVNDRTGNQTTMSDAFPEIKSKHSLVAKYVTKPLWEKLSRAQTKTSGFTLEKAIACAVQFDNQHCGIYAGDWDSYKVFSDVFDPIIQDYHGISPSAVHTSDMDFSKITRNVDPSAPVHSTRKQLVDDHFLFVSGDLNLIAAGMEREWPEGRGIFHNKAKTFLTWVNEEDQLRIISMQKGGDVKAVFERLARGIQAIGDSVKAESGKEFMLDPKYGYIHSCPTNLGTGMRASVHMDLPGFTKEGPKVLAARCEELHLQPRGTRGESGGQTGVTYDISNKHRLGYSEVELVQKMIDGVNTLYKEDEAFKKAHGI